MASGEPSPGGGAARRPLHSAQAVDVASASNFRAFELLHLHLDLRAEFGPPGPGVGSRGLSGTAVLDLRCLEPEGAVELRLDSHPCLEVTAAALRRERPGSEEPPAEPVSFYTQPFSHYGQALCVSFPQPCSAAERLQVLLTYRVGEGPGVCWLAPEQTAGKKKPFVYTQGQAVLNRAFFPCFDTPAVKYKYSALIEVPDGFTAVMSASTWEKRGPNKFFFQMCQPIPSYLIALAIGDLVSAEVGPRSRVWAEPCLIDAAKEEYNGVIEEFLATGVDPDDTYNETPYEKGFCFVSYLAHLVGDQDQFDNFLKAYVHEFKFQSILADDFLDFYLEYFPELKKKRVDIIPGFEFDRWLNTPGWPPYLPDLSPGDSLMKPAEELAQLWAAEELDVKAIEAVAISPWKTYQLVYFLDKILQKSPLPPGNVKTLGETYPSISNARNAELRLRWGQIVLKNDHQEDFWKVKEFLHNQGKQKYTLPLYHAMMGGSEVAQTLAKETFASTASQLHSNVVNYVQQIVAPKGS
ncbi:PREDICTED: aminopeptidase B isoform X5 [Cercocebus atys]|uniref:aminopeptidase B isoform X5 n=1 Tax=Cercocebus atys TaxID=9531 RepID=UPI0005F4BCCD|nr:PREDICTED: aminopeptidase B isoform X5 [Cercocebus atys]